MTIVQLLWDYRLRVQTTCCFSGHVSPWNKVWPFHALTLVKKWTLLDVREIRPSVRRRSCGRQTFLCPQFVDIELNDGLHPTKLIEVPRDILKIHYDVTLEADSLARAFGVGPDTAQDWLNSGFARIVKHALRETRDELDRQVHV